MDATIIAAVIGAIATLLAGFSSTIARKLRRRRGDLVGTVNDLVLSIDGLAAATVLRELLPKAKEVRLCGWSLRRTIDDNRHALRELVQRGGDLFVLVLDPASDSMRILDRFTTETDPIARKGRADLTSPPAGITRSDVLRVLAILRSNGLEDSCKVVQTLLPYGVMMVECEDGESWASVQMYPLHPDLRFDRRLGFTTNRKHRELWGVLRDNFDATWSDENLAVKAAGAAESDAFNEDNQAMQQDAPAARR